MTEVVVSRLKSEALGSHNWSRNEFQLYMALVHLNWLTEQAATEQSYTNDDAFFSAAVIGKSLRLPKSTLFSQFRKALEYGWIVSREEAFRLSVDGIRLVGHIVEAIDFADQQLGLILASKCQDRITHLRRLIEQSTVRDSYWNEGRLGTEWADLADANRQMRRR